MTREADGWLKKMITILMDWVLILAPFVHSNDDTMAVRPARKCNQDGKKRPDLKW